MANHILKTDTLNKGRVKINAAIDHASKAIDNSEQASNASNQAVQIAQSAESKSEYTQQQLDNIIIESGTSDAETIQARGKHSLLYERLDASDTNIQRSILDLNLRGANALLNGVVGDGITDDTQAIRDLLANNSYVVFPIPPVKYKITDEIVIPSNRTLEFIGGNHWNPNSQREVGFIYDGEEAPNKAMFRASKSPAGVEPSSDTSNVKFVGGCVLDGNNKIGYGFYAAYITNESSFDKISVINTTTDGIRVEKSWYAVFRDLVAKGNLGNGITIGKNGWGGVNGVLIENIRAHSNGFRGDFTESNYENGYGLGLYLGSSSKVLNITSEQNYGAGLLFSLGTGNVISIDTAYFEKNGIKAREDGKTHRNWGVIVKGSPTGSPKAIENIFLAGAGSENAQSIWLVGKGSKATLDLRNIGGGGILKSEWDSYTLTGYISSSITTGIEGCLPRKLEGTINSNWTTLYVRNNGNDNNDGRTSLTAFATIEKAIEVSKAIYTVHTIDCEGLSTQLATIDLKGIDREIMIDGKNTAVIDGSSSGNNGLSIRNSNNVVNINNFAKISRLTLVNCNQVKSINTKFGHKDNSYSGTMEIQNSGLYLKDCTLNGIDATNTTRNGIRLYNSALKTKELILSGYTNYFSISEGSTVYADSYLAAFGQMTWVDGTGFVIGGNRIRNAAGILTFA